MGNLRERLDLVEMPADWRIRSRILGMCLPLLVSGPDGRLPAAAPGGDVVDMSAEAIR